LLTLCLLVNIFSLYAINKIIKQDKKNNKTLD